MMKYDFKSFIEKATEITFSDMMEFSSKFKKHLISEGYEAIPIHQIAKCLICASDELIDEESKKPKT